MALNSNFLTQQWPLKSVLSLLLHHFFPILFRNTLNCFITLHMLFLSHEIQALLLICLVNNYSNFKIRWNLAVSIKSITCILVLYPYCTYLYLVCTFSLICWYLYVVFAPVKTFKKWVPFVFLEHRTVPDVGHGKNSCMNWIAYPLLALPTGLEHSFQI